MTSASPALPDDVEALQALVIAMAERAALLQERNAHLEQSNRNAEERIARLMGIIKMLERSRFGRRSEKLGAGVSGDEQYALILEEITTGVAALETERDAVAGSLVARRPARPRKAFPAHLERVEVIIEPAAVVGFEEQDRILIGEDVSERLDVTPARFRVIVTRRPKYVYRGLDGVVQAAAAPRIIENGLPTKRFSPRLRSPNMPMGFRSIARKRSMPVTRWCSSAR